MSKNTSLLDRLAKQAVNLPEEVVPVPEWGTADDPVIYVTLRGFTSRERDRFEEDNLRRASAKTGNGVRRRGAPPAEADLTNFRARLVARTIVENGERTFATSEAEELLGNQSAAILDRLFAVAQRLHGMTDADVEEMAGNSVATGAEDSSSDLRSSSDAPSLN